MTDKKFDPETGEILEGQEALLDVPVDPEQIFEGRRIDIYEAKFPSSEVYLGREAQEGKRAIGDEVTIMVTGSVAKVSHERRKGLMVRVHTLEIEDVNLVGGGK